jgi:hypothetical protein
MTRESIARAAVRLYPADLRTTSADELVGTLLDAGEHSLMGFIGQLASVILGGLGARSREASAQPVDQLLSDAIRWAAIMSVAGGLTMDVVTGVRWGDGSVPVAYDTILPAVSLVMFLARIDRAAGLAGLVYCIDFAGHHPLAPSGVRIQEVVQVAGLGLMTVHPRRDDTLRSLTLLPLLAWAFFWWTELGQHSGLGYLLPVFVALIFAGLKPALAVGTALSCAILAPYYLSMPGTTLHSVGLLSAVPVALALVGLSRALARRDEQPVT